MKTTVTEWLTKFVRPSAHSKFSPSSADRWMGGCHYSMNASDGVPSRSSKYAEEGTVAHKVAEHVFYNRQFMMPIPQTLMMEARKLELYTETTWPDMLRHGEEYSMILEAELRDFNFYGSIIWYGLERGIPIYPADSCFGTADGVIVGDLAASIIDYKYGQGHKVSEDAYQLKLYALGLAMGIANVPDSYKIRVIVVQPRIGVGSDVRTEYTIGELKEFAREVKFHIDESKRMDLQPCKGSWCHWCPIRNPEDKSKQCPIFRDLPVQAAKKTFEAFLSMTSVKNTAVTTSISTPERDESMKKIIALFPLLKDLEKEAREEFRMRMDAGEVIPGMEYIDKVSPPSFVLKGDELISELKRKFPSLQVTKTVESIRSITDIKKDIGKGGLAILNTMLQKKRTREIDLTTSEQIRITNSNSAPGPKRLDLI